MSILYPKVPPENSPRSELKVRNAIKQTTSYFVLHSIAWQSPRNGKQGDGEADFIIISPNRGILILEVKGGGIFIDNGTWCSIDRNRKKHKIKDPFQQAKDSKFALLNFFNQIDTSLTKIPIIHGVIFPDIPVNKIIGINAPR